MEFFKKYLLLKKMEEENDIEEEEFTDFFEEIEQTPLNTDIEFYSKINSSTHQISSYFKQAIKKFPTLFEKKIKSFKECLTLLEEKSIPNKCVCAGAIEIIPGWRCVDCSKYENVLYCNECYIQSKDLHENHNVVYLNNTKGMCDCGDPDSLSTYCHKHSGPFTTKKQIDEYFEKTFDKKELDNLNEFFDKFFFEFSKYLLLTEKCDLFVVDKFNEKFGGVLDEELKKEKKDIFILLSKFCAVFQNMIKFLRLITKKNLGMLHLMANYFLKNNLDTKKMENEVEDDFKVNHRCIELNQNEIKIFYENNTKNEKHICKCPFLRHFMSNFRHIVGSNKNVEEDINEFLFSFAHNLPLRFSSCIMYFFIYTQNLYNDNSCLYYCISQYYLEEGFEFLLKKTFLLEESTEILYKYLNKLIESEDFNEDVGPNKDIMNKIFLSIQNFISDIKHLSKPKMRLLMVDKTILIKKIIDIYCLFHNIEKYKSIFPHPGFQKKMFSAKLFFGELYLIKLPCIVYTLFDWNKIDKLKEIYKYIINKILNQKKEEIKQLEENEFSFNLILYRCFGSYINAFCLNYSLINNCTVFDSVNYFKKNFFDSQAQTEIFCDMILEQYFKFFGFLLGSKNNFFNYYDIGNMYYRLYTTKKYDDFYITDFTLLKYIFFLKEKKIDIISYLKISNIENVYSTFDKIFNLDINLKKNTLNEININNDDNKNISNNNVNNNINTNNNTNINNNPGERIEVPSHANIITNLNSLTAEEKTFFLRKLLYEKHKKEEKNLDDFNIIMQWENLLEFIIYILKDDSCIYHCLMKNYDDIISSKIKSDLFNDIKKNKYVMQDIKNILEEKIIHIIIAEGNLIDMKNLEEKIDKYIKILLEKDEIFEQILNNLTYSKLKGETKMFYLKDDYLKRLDCNYYVNNQEKSEAQKYILDFKKDKVKTYNYFYYNQSELTFDFYEKIYQNIFLNKNNLELMIKIVEKLINDDEIMENLDKKSVRNSFFPIILNYLSIFSVINTKSFILFKLDNKVIINKLFELLFNFVKNNEKNNIIDKDLELNIKEILNQMNRYKLINDYYDGDLSKLNKYDYNVNIINEINKNKNPDINNINFILDEKNNIDEIKQKSKKKKDKLKLMMKKNAVNFMKKLETNESMIKAIDEEIEKDKNMKNSDDEIMCFYCRNSIKMNSFIEPYGKLGLIIKDNFYINSKKSTLREELKDKKDIYNKIINNIYGTKFYRIISCGHYFHYLCFNKSNKENNKDDSGFNCPLCLKKQNILIPPLTSFHDKFFFFKKENIDILLKREDSMNINSNNSNTNNKEYNLFDDMIKNFLTSIQIINSTKFNRVIKYDSLLDDMYPYYISYLNSLENVFYSNGTTFHKQQHIDNIKILILSLRLISYESKIFKKKEIIEFIKINLIQLSKGPIKDEEFIYKYHDTYMHYINLFEKIILSLIILFDYDEIKEMFKYIIYIFLPYFIFGLYFKKIIIDNNDNKNRDKEYIINKINLEEIKIYLKDNNKYILDCFHNFLKKFCLIKLISDYENKNEEILNCYNELTITNILTIINLSDLLKILPQKDISISVEDFISSLPKIFNSNDTLYKMISQDLNYDKVLNLIIENVKKNSTNKIYEINKELIIQFSPIKFNFINLPYKIFDFIEENTGKECCVCDRLVRETFLCFICGKKVCSPFNKAYDEREIVKHSNICASSYCIYVDMNNMTLFYFNKDGFVIKFFPIYVNKTGNGPKIDEITNNFYLSDEKIKLIIKNYICNDFYFD